MGEWVGRAEIDQGSAGKLRRNGIPQPGQRYVRRRILIFPEVANRDVATRRKELAQPLIVIGVLVREDDGVNRRSVQSELVEVSAVGGWLRAAADEDCGTARLDEDHISLNDVEHS